MTPLKLIQRSRQNAIEHIKLLVRTYNITTDEIYEEDDFIKALDEASNNGSIN